MSWALGPTLEAHGCISRAALLWCSSFAALLLVPSLPAFADPTQIPSVTEAAFE